MYKYLVAVILTAFSLQVYSGFDNSEGNLKVLNFVDHDKHELIIQDQVYKMPINFKVYKIDARIIPYREVNRYALQKGQSVYINTFIRSRKNYVAELLIVE